MAKKNPYHDESMFKGAPSDSFQKAKILRSNATKEERIMWEMLNAGVFRLYKFRRQHPIHIYIADFYSHRLQLIIEIDGEYHNQKAQIQKDDERSEILISQDVTVIRFSNHEVTNELSKIKTILLTYIQSFEQKSRHILPRP